MANYLAMNRDELTAEKAALEAKYKEFQAKGLKLNMARGKPGPHQMDLAMDLLKMNDYTTDAGTDARNYGELEGLQEARVLFADVFGVQPGEVFVGGNSSLQLMYNLINIGYVFGFPESPCPWSQVEKRKFLCPVPGYDRHFAITEEFGFELIGVPMTPNGPDMDIVEKLVAEDPDIKGIWCVPMYSNPDGITYSDETVRRFAALRPAAEDFRIMWDNAYCVHHLYDTGDRLLNLYEEAQKQHNEDIVIQFTSTSKISFPGSGMAALAASPKNLADIKSRMTVQTIGHDKLNMLRHARFFKDIDGINAHMREHAAILRPKFELVLRVLSEKLADTGIAQWHTPRGGYFVSVNLMDGCAKEVHRLLQEAGVTMTAAGATYPYGNDPHDSNLRIAPSFPPLSELQTAMELFCICAQIAAIRKLLEKNV